MATPPEEPIQPLAGLLALALPGCGHLFLRKYDRAFYAALGILGLFFGGLLIGGIDSVDSQEDRIWFLGQALVGPIAFGVDHLHQSRFKGWAETTQPDPNRPGSVRTVFKTRSPYPGETLQRGSSPVDPGKTALLVVPSEEPNSRPASSKSLGRMNELGTLFTTLAGMLNLIVVLDALFPGRRKKVEGA
jgi:hypothetical protein